MRRLKVEPRSGTLPRQISALRWSFAALRKADGTTIAAFPGLDQRLAPMHFVRREGLPASQSSHGDMSSK
jgi:hypothetical protein